MISISVVCLALLLHPSQATKAPLGINLTSVVDWSTELVFVDQFRIARRWISQAKGKPWGQGGPLDVDADGHLRSLQPDQYAETMLWTDFGKSFPEGTFVCLYEGDGELTFWGDARISRSAPGRIELAVRANTGTASLRIMRTNPLNPVRNIRVIHPGFERIYTSKPFHPTLLRRWVGCKVVRFMDWQKTNNSKQVQWSDRPRLTSHSQAVNGVCVELMCEFCNTTGMDPWFCIPHRATDDYIVRFCELVKARLDPKRTVYLEYSNECWNNQFEQARYCAEMGQKLGLSTNAFTAQLRFYSQRSVEMFTLAEKVLGKARLVRVLATQASNPWTGTTVLDWQNAHQKADAIAIAPYFGGRLGSPKTADMVAKMSVETLLDELAKDQKENIPRIQRYAEEAKKRKLRLLAYEGGQHLAGHGGAENNEALTRLFHAANRHPRMKQLYARDYAIWNAAGGDLFVVFSSVSRYSKWGSWGQLEMYNQTTSPKYEALREYLGLARP
ncbi:MAG: hypothetical protein SNJ75_00550 [Gemmataceae bacterium]